MLRTLLGFFILLFSLQLLYSQSIEEEFVNDSFVLESPSIDETLFLLEEDSSSGIAPMNAAFTFGGVIQAILALLFVLALLYATLFFLRKISGKEHKASEQIHILETQTLKAGATISIVEITGRYLVLGVAETITPLLEITDQESIDNLKLKQSMATPPSDRFLALVKDQFKKKNPSPISTQEDLDPLSSRKENPFLKNYTSRLNNPEKSTPFDEKLDE